MKWSKWSAAAVMMLASAGSAWSQTPAPAAKSPDGAAERIMTLHENGKSVRCRIISSWKTKEGANAYQLQAVEGGEMITIVADNPETSAKDATASKSNSLPMRIYHWGRSRVAPPGVPTNPEASTPTPVTSTPRAASPATAITTPPVSKVVTTKTSPGNKDQTVWWEEKDGKRVSPIVVTSGINPFENQTVVQSPVSGQPVPVVIDKKGSTLVTLPAKDEPRMFTSAPTVRTVAHTDPSVPVTTMPMAKGDEERVVIVQEKSPRLLQKLFPPKPSVSQAEQIIVTTSPAAPANAQTGPTALPGKSAAPPTSVTTVQAPAPSTTAPTGSNAIIATPTAALAKSGSPVTPVTASGFVPSSQAGSDAIPTTAAAATITKVETITPAPKQTLLAKIGNVIHPKRNTDIARSIESKDPPSQKIDTASAGSAPRTSSGVAPFSTALDRSMSYPDSNASQGSTKKDWRTMWGRSNDKSQLPGQSMVDQASAGQGDILLNPEKFDPAGNKLVPRGINMTAYRGDPAQLMGKNQVPGVEQASVQGGMPQYPASQPPPLPGDGRYPPGYQSVVAASNPNLTYVPVPPSPTSDSSRMPAPPQSNAYVNAFTPPPPNVPANAFSNNRVPQPAPPQIPPPQMAQAYPQAGPPVFLPSPANSTAMAQPTYAPQVPNPEIAQMQPSMQSPVPQAVIQPPPTQQPVQPTQYSSPPLPPSPSPMANPAMDRRQATQTSPPGSELTQVLEVLKESPYPAQREWAANTMATYDWRAHPEVVQVLLQVAQQDPAATVRASCVYSLGRMNAAGEPVLGVLRTLSNDADARVRDEVEQALVRLGAGKPQ